MHRIDGPYHFLFCKFYQLPLPARVGSIKSIDLIDIEIDRSKKSKKSIDLIKPKKNTLIFANCVLQLNKSTLESTVVFYYIIFSKTAKIKLTYM